MKKTLYSFIPQEKLDSVINLEISDKTTKGYKKLLIKN